MPGDDYDYEDDDFEVFDDDEDEASEDDDFDDGDDASDVADEDDASDVVIEEEVEEEPAEPDNQDAVHALRDLGARVDLNDKGRAWRIILYHRHKDDVLNEIHGLPCLEQVWLMGSRVTPAGAKKLRDNLPEECKIFE